MTLALSVVVDAVGQVEVQVEDARRELPRFVIAWGGVSTIAIVDGLWGLLGVGEWIHLVPLYVV